MSVAQLSRAGSEVCTSNEMGHEHDSGMEPGPNNIMMGVAQLSGDDHEVRTVCGGHGDGLVPGIFGQSEVQLVCEAETMAIRCKNDTHAKGGTFWKGDVSVKASLGGLEGRENQS